MAEVAEVVAEVLVEDRAADIESSGPLPQMVTKLPSGALSSTQSPSFVERKIRPPAPAMNAVSGDAK